MTKEEKIAEVMELADKYGDACQDFGDFQSERNANRCESLREDIENKLRELIKDDE